MKREQRRKSYQELKEDPYIKAPALAWLLERKSVYITAAVVGCLATGGFIYQGVQSFNSIVAPPEVNSPYLAVEPVLSPGADWATEFLSKSYSVKGWEMKDALQPTHGFMQEATNNAAGEVPLTLLATRVASAGNNVKAIAQVYGAGQARQQFDSYVNKLTAKGSIAKDKDKSGVEGVKFEHGFLLVAGDAIVGAQAANNETRDRLYTDFLNNLKKTLPVSGCKNLAAVDESQRSLYFNANKFEGLKESKSVATQVEFGGMPTLQSLGTHDVKNPYANKPEAPLPSTIEDIPDEAERPTISDAPQTLSGFVDKAVYQIDDPVGPGCGWGWSAQSPLQYDAVWLATLKNDAIVKVQDAVNAEAQEYVDSKISWARLTAMLAPKIDNWNQYVKKVDSIHKSWSKLVKDREALRPSWNAYVAAYEDWSTFDARKAAAQDSYDASVKQCKLDREKHDEWEAEWGVEALKLKQDEWRKQQEEEARQEAVEESEKAEEEQQQGENEASENSEESTEPSETPSPSPTPEKPRTPSTPMPTAPAEPKDCTVEPSRPAILDQAKPAKPQPPAIPEDVTIPNSWPHPEG